MKVLSFIALIIMFISVCSFLLSDFMPFSDFTTALEFIKELPFDDFDFISGFRNAFVTLKSRLDDISWLPTWLSSLATVIASPFMIAWFLGQFFFQLLSFIFIFIIRFLGGV